MIHIAARKKVDVHRIDCLLQLVLSEKRPDLVWFLRQLKARGSWNLSRGEEKNIEQYLQYLGLINDRDLTQAGEDALERDYVMIPEAGLYELLFVKDQIFGNRIIHYQRKQPRDIPPGDTQDFTDSALYDEKIHINLSEKSKSDKRFWIRFQRQHNETPKVIFTGILDADLTVTYDSKKGSSICSFILKKNNLNISTSNSLNAFSPEENLSSWLKNWDSEIKAVELTFDEAKENPATLNGFRTSMGIEGKELFLGEVIDGGDWYVEVTVPAVPKTKKDAEAWITRLLTDDLTKKERYLSVIELEKLEHDKLVPSPIGKKFKDFFIPAKRLLKRWKEEEKDTDIYRRVMAIEDLNFSSQVLEVIE